MAGKEPRRKRKKDEGAEIPMTPMIDVVFQLLIYFVFTMKPIDVSAHLDVFRPSKGEARDDQVEKPQMIKVEIFPGTILMNQSAVDIPGLTRILGKLAAISTEQTVIILCARDSKHSDLVAVLDACAKVGLTNLSVGSMN